MRSIAYVDNPVFTTPLPSTTPGQPPGQSFDDTGENSFSDNSFSLTLAFDVRDDVNVYLKSSEAYKGGGFNVRDPDPEFFKAGFDQENVQSYELGIKSELLNRRLRLNADVFLSDYEDIQINFLIGNSIADTQVVNAGRAEIRGLEADITWLASHALLLTLNYAYLDAEMKEVIDPDTGADVTDEYTFWSTPKHSWTAAVDYTLLERSWGKVVFGGSYNYMDTRNGASVSRSVPNTRLEAYSLVNARLGISSIPLFGGELQVSAWSKNLLDEEYVISAVDQQPPTTRAVLWGEARSSGLDLVYTY